MNFLKKKIKNVVQGKRNKDDDDDDFDNYVPAVPPHPSQLSENGAASGATASENLFASFQSTLSSITSTADSAAKSIAGLASSIEPEQDPSEQGKLSLEELKAREEEHKRVEKEKLKQQEESKKDKEEWKYFLSLTAKVEAVTSKTQSALSKLKDESAVKEISKIEDPCFVDKYDHSAPKEAGGWIAFEEQQQFNPADPIFTNPPTQEESPPEEKPVVDENTHKLVRELIDDFGFTGPSSGIAPLQATVVNTFTEDVDPFDTSFIDIEAIKSGKTLKPTELIQNLDISESEFDPFDTSHVEAAITQDLVVQEDQEEDVKPPSAFVICFIMSNPFLVDLEESYTPYLSGVNTPCSGRATPKRRNSTNPFEVLSPDSEEPIFLDSDAIQSSNEINNNTSTGTTVASAIANMTAEFYQTITKFDFDSTINDEVFDENSRSKTEDSNANDKPVKTVTTITYDNNGCVFDPFETIHDDDALSSKRSSIENQANTKDALEAMSHISNSAKAKEMFNSSMAGIELLAASGNMAHSAQSSDLSPTSPTTPQSNCENAFLSAPQGMDIYSSDLSDMSDVSPTTANDVRSAFIKYQDIDKEEIPKFEPIANSEIIKRKISLTRNEDDFEQKSTIKLASSEHIEGQTGLEETADKSKETAFKAPSVVDRCLESAVTGSVDIYEVGNPNAEAEGIINDAFEEMDKEESQPEMVQPEPKEDRLLVRESSLEVCEVQSNNIQPNDLRELVEPNHDEQMLEDQDSQPTDTCEPVVELKVDASAPSEPAAEDSDPDPFNTSAFDSDAFDAFESRFEATEAQQGKSLGGEDPFASPYKTAKSSDNNEKNTFDTFEPFIPKQPENTPFKPKPKKKDSFEDSSASDDSEEESKLVIVVRMKDSSQTEVTNTIAPLLPPPPKSPRHLPQLQNEDSPDAEDNILTSYKTPFGKNKSTAKSFLDDEFDRFFSNAENRTAADGISTEESWPTAFGEAASKRTAGGGESPSSPQTPLYDEDTTQPLEDFPARYLGDGWEMMLRHPAKKKLTANRYWKKIFVKFVPETCLLQLFNKKGDPQPFQELPLQASYSLSEISAQQYDQYGKIFTIKVQYIFYRERVGVRPGQIAKVMQGQIQSMGDFARLGMPVEHAPQVSELLKLGSLEYLDLKEFVQVVEESMFRMSVHRDRSLTYRTEEIQCVVQDELYVEQNKLGIVEKQLARVRVFFLAFLNGIPAIEVGINDLRRQGKEVVGRHDILPVVTEEWIRVELPEFHSCVQTDVFDTSQVVKLIPPDACHFELMRFRIRPPKNRELPLQVSAFMNITPTKMELKCDILVPGCISRKHGQIPCEDIQIRFHIPECWIYFFRVEKHFRMGAVHSTNRRSGKLKGFERILGTTANPEPQLIEVTAGQAKYEHAYHSIVWRIPRLPKDGQGAYTQQLMLVRLPLSSFDRIPESFYDFVHVEFHMPSTTVSHTTLRSISVNSENPPEKFVRYNAKYEYKIGLNISYDDTKPEPEYISSTGGLNNGSVKSSAQDAGSSEEDNGKDSEH